MPFTESPNLDDNPLVRVFFSGLMIMKPSASECEIFVHRTAGPPAHDVTIEVRSKLAGQRDLILARIKGPLVPIPGTHNGVIIRTVQAGGTRAYVGPAKAEGAPLVGNPPTNAVDINEFHPGKTDVDTLRARPSISMNEGVFYSADITPPGLVIDLFHDTTLVRRLTPFARLIGANISNTTEVVWVQNGHLQTLSLQADAGTPGLNYEIYVINDPLFEPPPNPGEQPHDELQEYYKILPNIPQNERLRMQFVSIPSGGRGSSRTPCMSIIDNG